MSGFPALTANGRAGRIAVVAILALGRALGVGMAAIATRDIFSTLANGFRQLPLSALLIIGASGIIIAFFRWSERVVAEKLGQDYAAAVRLRLFDHISRLPDSELSKRRTGGLSLRFVGDLSSVRSWISQGVTRLLSAAITIPAVGVILFYINQKLALVGLVPIILGLVAIGLTGPALLPAHGRLRQQRSKLASDATERLTHVSELRLSGRFPRERQQIKRSNQDMITAALQRRRRSSFIRVIPDVISGLAVAGVLGVALTQSISGAAAAGTLAALGMLIQTLRELGSVWDRYCAWRAARARCLALLETQPMPKTDPSLQGGREQTKGTQVILSRVSYQHLKRIDAAIEPGQKVAITGANGSGKSTLLKLIAGVEQPSRGRILFDQSSQIKWINSVNKRIVYIGSNSPILRGSLRKALTMGVHPRPDDTEIEAAARRFGLGSVLRRLAGLDGRVSENGRNLSAGEVKRLLLIRAVLSSADLLLLDEIDQALDKKGMKLLDELIHKNAATVLVVSQNTKLLRSMDKLWKIEKGALIVDGNETGTDRRATAG